MGWLGTGGGQAGASEGVTTLLGPGSVFEGTLELASSVCIEGTFRGSLECQGRVVLAKDGLLEADVVAESVAVHGALHGSVVAREQLHVGETGAIRGDVVAGSITVARGGRLEGLCRMAAAEGGAQDEAGGDPVEPVVLTEATG